MLKLTGGALIIISCSMIGKYIGLGYLKKLRLHEKLLQMYNETTVLLEYSYMTFDEIITSLNNSSAFEQLDFLCICAHDINIRCNLLDKIECWDKIDNVESKDNLRDFFSKLGTTDNSGQITYSRLAAEREKEIIDRCKGEMMRRSKLASSIGFSTGVLLTIMLI